MRYVIVKFRLNRQGGFFGEVGIFYVWFATRTFPRLYDSFERHTTGVVYPYPNWPNVQAEIGTPGALPCKKLSQTRHRGTKHQHKWKNQTFPKRLSMKSFYISFTVKCLAQPPGTFFCLMHHLEFKCYQVKL